jgi:phosphoenolpyruvate carboxykinase (GTP)
MGNVASICDEWEDPSGFKLDAILFGGRRATNVPLVTRSNSWEHGVFMGATVSSEQTAAAEGPVGKLRRDPFAMLPFCGYNMADYFGHWLSFADRMPRETLPVVFQVNWFRKDAEGKFIWPGFAENSRVLDWIIGSLEGTNSGVETPIGLVPARSELKLEGLDLTDDQLTELLSVKSSSWDIEVADTEEFFGRFGSRMPEGLKVELAGLKGRLKLQSEQSPVAVTKTL